MSDQPTKGRGGRPRKGARKRPPTLKQRMALALKLNEQFVSKLAARCPSLLPEFRTLMLAHSAMMFAFTDGALKELKREMAHG